MGSALAILVLGGCASEAEVAAPPTLVRDDVVATMKLVNDRFMAASPATSAAVWNRSVYFEGLMALHATSPDPRTLAYATTWADSHQWGMQSGPSTRFADDQCAAQTYLELDAVDHDEAHVHDAMASLDAMVASDVVSDWTWVDAIQMAMPLFARAGVLRADQRYLDKMHALYMYTRDAHGGGLYSQVDHLWWRDAKFRPPYAEPNGASCFWARGNGWAYAGLVRVLDVLPADEPHRSQYVADYVAMSESLRRVARDDGFWNASLHDPTHFGGKELTGTSLITYGMAWGVAHGVLPVAIYRPVVERSWTAMVRDAVHPDGRLGYVQGTAAGPSDRMPVTYDTVPNEEDFAVGCLLLAGSAVASIAR